MLNVLNVYDLKRQLIFYGFEWLLKPTVRKALWQGSEVNYFMKERKHSNT